MSKISMLRSLVNKGWTIANRKSLSSSIGKSQFDEISQLLKESHLASDVFEFSAAKEFLTPSRINQARCYLLNNSTKWHNPSTKNVENIKDIKMHFNVHGENVIIRKELKQGNISDSTKAIDNEFSKLPKTEENYVFYRGRMHSCIKSSNVDFDVINNANIGDTIIPDIGYSYTAFEKSLAELYGSAKGRATMMQVIRVPKGAQISMNVDHGGEALMPRGAKYKLLSKEVDQNNCMEVILEYILPKR